MRALFAVTLAALLLVPSVGAEDKPPPPKITVAVLDFEAGVDETKNLARTLPDEIESELAMSTRVRLVTRRDLAKIQKEQSLDLAGLVAKGHGTRVGRLIGAQVLVFGRATIIDSEILLTARLVGSETGALLPAVVRGEMTKDLGPLVKKLAERLRLLLAERAGELLPGPDPILEVEKKLASEIAKLQVRLPTVGVVVFEEHLRAARQIDPAAETEMLAVLKRLGFPLREIGSKEVRAWLRGGPSKKPSFPPPADRPLGVDVLLLGQGFSEFAGRVGELVSAKARLEVRAVRVRTGKILGVFHDANAAADLAETFAGKEALRALGRKAALGLAIEIAKAGKAKKKVVAPPPPK